MTPFRGFILFAVSIPALAQGNRETYQGREVVAAQVILQLRDPANGALVQQVRQLAGADNVRQIGGPAGPLVLHAPGKTVGALVAALRPQASTAFVEPDYIVKASAVPNDAGFPQQWPLLNAGNPGADIGATRAWDVSTGSTAYVVGVVDTGVDYNHADLAPNTWSAPAAFTVNLRWGQITCPAGSHGYNAIARTCDPADDHGHGTHVSGTIGAVGNNGAGVAGINWSTRIMALKFMDSTGSGSISNAIDAIEFAIQAKAALGGPANVRVLSNSWGANGFSQSLLNEINRAGSSDILFVAAAGNDGANNDVTPTYPASYSAANLISVAATDSADGLAGFSNYGAGSVTMGAPGVNVLSTLPGGAYGYGSGTSMATPHVSGSAALVLAGCGYATAALRSALVTSVDARPSLAGKTVSGGRLNVDRAIRTCASAPPPPASGSAQFVRADTTTQGNWRNAYGADGFSLSGDATQNPPYGTTGVSGNTNITWYPSTQDVRALQKGATANDRVAAAWFSNSSFQIDINLTDNAPHQVALYALDFDYQQRQQRVEVLDAGTFAVLDSRTQADFYNGAYLVWNLKGHVILRISYLSGQSAVVDGVFFGGAVTPVANGGGATATFLRTDTTTEGNWKGAYGADGYTVVGDYWANPAYAAVTPTGYSPFTWYSSTSDVRALEKATFPGDRVASAWTSNSPFLVDVNLTDGGVHQLAVYCDDWDYAGRAQTVEILDANSNAVLDSRSESGFSSGVYQVWNVSGHVKIRVTPLTAASGVIQGLFFR